MIEEWPMLPRSKRTPQRSLEINTVVELVGGPNDGDVLEVPIDVDVVVREVDHEAEGHYRRRQRGQDAGFVFVWEGA